MKRLRLIFVSFLFLASSIFTVAQKQPYKELLPRDFSDRAFEHIEFMSSLGHRQIGSENDIKTVNYLKEQFQASGLSVEVQPFEFESFEYVEANLRVDGKKLEVMGLGFNPYKDPLAFEGTAVVLDCLTEREFPREELRGKVIITNSWAEHFNLLRLKPKLIIYLNPTEFAKIPSEEDVGFKLSVSGGPRIFQSANVVGQIGKSDPDKKEILITAHFDTYRKNNPGASDNASGVSVILELAEYFKKIDHQLPCILKFVAFGGEEIGVVGSRHYLQRNHESLKKCELLFNIDDVGGHRNIVLEMEGGIKGMPPYKGLSQLPDYIKTSPLEGIDSYWRILADDELLKIFGSSNHPNWLVDVVTQAVDSLGYDVIFTDTQGSDQLTFAQAGIVTSGIGIIGDHGHTPEDKPGYVNKDSLKKAGEIAANIVINTLEIFREEK